MRKLKLLGAIMAAAFLAGCATDIQQIRTAEGTGSPFTQALTKEYRDFVVFEADEMYDWTDADYFARKGLMAAEGQVVQPEELAGWDLPEDKIGELADARARLVKALDGGGRDQQPELAAKAQAKFDCWVEQQEENHQPDDIAACRGDFLDVIAKLEAALGSAPAPAGAAPETYVVYFDFDKSDIRADASAVIQQILADAKARGQTVTFTVTGHADRSGSEDYNLVLSLQRADAVRNALVEGGVEKANITVSGRGEAENAVPTKDGVREQANRRVEIIVQ